MVCLAPLPTFYQIFKKKTSEGFQSIPYVIALFSAMLWLFYAIFDDDSTLLITINSFTFFMEIGYITVYLIYATKNDRMFTTKLLLFFNVFGFGIICILTLSLTHGRSVLMFLDGFVPNILGFLFGLAQMMLYFIYRKPKKLPVQEPKLRELSGHIVDVAKLGATLCYDINTVVVPLPKDDVNNVEDQKVKEERRKPSRIQMWLTKFNLEMDMFFFFGYYSVRLPLCTCNSLTFMWVHSSSFVKGTHIYE
ncbi:hypothetical protein GH714_024805 [Hevea brasiliensis]|uniref:Bidirectional sugar transporter SWEET n=1 Tax=Hevea brasiliensis TaxID=3981 RepID=A0A6A6MGK0_HEVBR|nr:hypothetical protein GH714_024805 [Hevea brasiliensis]